MKTLIIMILSNFIGTQEIIFNDSTTYIDIAKYLGKWYEIARLDHPFEKNMEKVTAEYILQHDGSIKVINSGYRKGKHKVAEGKAKTTNTPGLLRVSFFMNIYSDYRVLYIDENYEYVLVGGSSPRYLWILSRKPQLSKEIIASLVENAKERGYNTEDIIMVHQ